jgi:tetratricopeptide (TPR) repeat protein
MANCLSLTIMVYAMAEHIGLNASFKEVNIPEFWTRQGGNTLINGHINLQVEPQQNHQTFLFNVSPVVVDFDPLQSSHRFSSQVISKDKVTSYFYTNKAADAMISKNYDLAFAYLKAALNVYPNNEGALLNLGVLFRRNNMMVEAEASYREVLLANSSNIVALDNLGLLYRKTGRVALADAIEIRLKRKRHDNPYYHIMLGDIALEDKKLEQAIRHYKDSIDLNEQNHEVYFKLAKAYFALGDTDNTKRYLQSAKKRVKGMPFESRYASKLAILAQR